MKTAISNDLLLTHQVKQNHQDAVHKSLTMLPRNGPWLMGHRSWVGEAPAEEPALAQLAVKLPAPREEGAVVVGEADEVKLEVLASINAAPIPTSRGDQIAEVPRDLFLTAREFSEETLLSSHPNRLLQGVARAEQVKKEDRPTRGSSVTAT